MIYWIAYYILKFFTAMFCPFTSRGAQDIPREGAFIFACNHLSNLDPFLVGLNVHRKVNYLAKDSLFKNKFFGLILRGCGAFPIRRGASDIGAMKVALGFLKRGEPLLVFPQGTRSGNKVNPGVGFLAIKSSVPVVPVKLVGTDRVLPRGAKRLHRHPIQIVFGKPLRFNRQDEPGDVAARIMTAIDSLPG